MSILLAREEIHSAVEDNKYFENRTVDQRLKREPTVPGILNIDGLVKLISMEIPVLHITEDEFEDRRLRGLIERSGFERISEASHSFLGEGIVPLNFSGYNDCLRVRLDYKPWMGLITLQNFPDYVGSQVGFRRTIVPAVEDSASRIYDAIKEFRS